MRHRPGGRPATDSVRIAGTDSVESLIARMASAAPSAAGGAAAALTAAAAAALVAMVAGIAARHAPGDSRLGAVSDEARALSRRLTALIGDDEAAYAAVLQARRREASTSAAAVRGALTRATEVPLEVARASAAVLTRAAQIADAARAGTRADLGAAAALAAAALEAAALIARANLADLDDPGFVRDAGQALDRLLAQGASGRRELSQTLGLHAATPTAPR